jgi:uncharacterized protein YdeI (YjbR/CyaY-like superfamily)
MTIGQTLYVKDRNTWRKWLKANHARKKEIWLIYYKKESGKPRIPYNDAVEEALCFGWIDSILKPIDKEKYAQRFSPRKPASQLSAMNRERILRLKRQKKMTVSGLAAVSHAMHHSEKRPNFSLPADIKRALKKDPKVWANYTKFPASYKRIRIGWIHGSRQRMDVFRQRLQYFLKMTRKNKRFGMVQ